MCPTPLHPPSSPECVQSLAESLDAAVRADDPYFNKLIRIMATRCMTQAVYLSSGACRRVCVVGEGGGCEAAVLLCCAAS